MEWTQQHLPRYHPISISGYHIREAGATAAQELAFTLADGFAYVELGVERGLAVDDFAPRLSFFFDAHIDFFEEIAKFRAARRIWARWMRDRYGATTDRAQWLRFHTQTAGVSLTAQQPQNNVVRTAVEALAAVLGGTNSLHTNALDEVLALPTEAAAEVALRTQQVLLEETGVASVIDPLGGSWFVEASTDRIERGGRGAPRRDPGPRVDGQSMTSGIVAGIESGWFTGQIADAADEHQRDAREAASVASSASTPTRSTVGRSAGGAADLPARSSTTRWSACAERRATRDADRGRAARSTTLAVAARGERQPGATDARRGCGPRRPSARSAASLREVFGGYTEPPDF